MTSRKCLVVSFGGYTGIAFLGILHALNERNNLESVTHYYGTSIGAIICALLAAGLTPFQIFSEFCQQDHVFKPNLLEFIFGDAQSLASFQPFEHQLCAIFRKYVNHIPTFSSLAQRGRYLHIYTYSLDSHKMIEFSYTTTPHHNILDPVVASAAIPLVFAPKQINDQYYIDGAIINPLPLAEALDNHTPSEMIVVYTEPWDPIQLQNSKLGALIRTLNLPVHSSFRRASAQITPEMLAIKITDINFQITKPVTLIDKWSVFLRGISVGEAT